MMIVGKDGKEVPAGSPGIPRQRPNGTSATLVPIRPRPEISPPDVVSGNCAASVEE